MNYSNGSKRRWASAMLVAGGLLWGNTATAGLVNSGKVLATGGVINVDGAGGGGIAPWATISGYATRDGINGGLHYTWVYLPDYSLNSYGFTAGFFDRLELSYTRSTLPTGGTFDTVGLISDAAGLDTGIEPFNTTIKMDVYGAKLRLFGDAVYTSDSWIPQVAIGGHWKENKNAALMNTLQAADTEDWEAYAVATKIFFPISTLVSVAGRYTSANQTGLTGFGGPDGNDKELRLEVSIAHLLSKNTAFGFEYAQHGDNLGGHSVELAGLDLTGVTGLLSDLGLGTGDTLTQLPEDDWFDAFFAYFPNKNISFVFAYAMLGNITLTPEQHGFYISMHATW
ncbi:DUF3034 family protein [Oceanococcus atlanticus]|nr:DUF3034 family protein [Oceanococcus atlanticus]